MGVLSSCEIPATMDPSEASFSACTNSLIARSSTLTVFCKDWLDCSTCAVRSATVRSIASRTLRRCNAAAMVSATMDKMLGSASSKRMAGS